MSRIPDSYYAVVGLPVNGRYFCKIRSVPSSRVVMKKDDMSKDEVKNYLTKANDVGYNIVNLKALLDSIDAD